MLSKELRDLEINLLVSRTVKGAWDSKYTVNINTEMNYWPSEVTDNGENLTLAQPMLRPTASQAERCIML